MPTRLHTLACLALQALRALEASRAVSGQTSNAGQEQWARPSTTTARYRRARKGKKAREPHPLHINDSNNSTTRGEPGGKHLLLLGQMACPGGHGTLRSGKHRSSRCKNVPRSGCGAHPMRSASAHLHATVCAPALSEEDVPQDWRLTPLCSPSFQGSERSAV